MELVSEEKINDIRMKADIVNIISSYIPLKMQGKNYFGVCPFHDDHTPSMSVSPEKQMYKCFVCNKGGNVFTFVKDYENISYIEAVKKVANIVGIPLDIKIEAKKENRHKNELEIMEFATNIFQNNLSSKEGNAAKKYLSSRNIDDNIIKEFRIGLSLKDNTYMYNILTKKYDINTLDELGLITKSGASGYDKFIGRIMIPICNLDGDVVGYTGRIYEDNDDTAKYINTKETIIYKKGNILFNYHNAKNHIKNEKYCILVEGNMDAIRMYTEGVKNVLALMGTALTKEQVDILKKLRVPIILMLDNDDAGELATESIGSILTKNNVPCKVVRLEGAKDPDEYIVKFGVDKFKDAIKHSLNYFDYKLITLKKDKNLNNTEELIGYVKEVAKMLEGTDNLTKEITLKKISEEYNIDYDIIKNEVKFDSESESPPPITQIVRKDVYKLCVEKIFYYMMSDIKYVEIYNDKLGYLKNKDERSLVNEIEYYIDKYKTINIADFITYAENKDNIRELVHTISGNVFDEELKEKIFIEYLNKINNLMLDDEIKELKNSYKMTIDINEKVKITEKIKELVKMRSERNERN